MQFEVVAHQITSTSFLCSALISAYFSTIVEYRLIASLDIVETPNNSQRCVRYLYESTLKKPSTTCVLSASIIGTLTLVHNFIAYSIEWNETESNVSNFVSFALKYIGMNGDGV